MLFRSPPAPPPLLPSLTPLPPSPTSPRPPPTVKERNKQNTVIIRLSQCLFRTRSRPILFMLLFKILVDIILIVRFVLKRHDASKKKCQRNYFVYFCAISCPKVTSKQAIPLYSFAYFASFITLVSNPHPFIASKVAWNLGYCCLELLRLRTTW